MVAARFTSSAHGHLRLPHPGRRVLRADGNITTSRNIDANINAAGDICGKTICGNSDRDLKEEFAAIDSREVLVRVAALPVCSWNFKSDPATRHVGPMAQNFYAAFNVGADDKHIATLDTGGVALAAIQGLNQKLEAEVKAKDAEIEALKPRLDSIEQMLRSQGR